MSPFNLLLLVANLRELDMQHVPYLFFVLLLTKNIIYVLISIFNIINNSITVLLIHK